MHILSELLPHAPRSKRCSFEALHTAGLKVKVANKQFVGLDDSGVGLDGMDQAAHDVFVLNGSLWVCKHASEPIDFQQLRALSSPACDLALPGVQKLEGKRQRFEVTQSGCGKWMPQEFRMCATHLKGKRQQVRPLV